MPNNDRTPLVKRTQAEIDKVMNWATEGIDSGSRFPGMSYEEGLHAGISWMLGESDDNPVEDK